MKTEPTDVAIKPVPLEKLRPDEFGGAKALNPKRPRDFAHWLARQAQKASEVWVVLYKKKSGRQKVFFDDVLIEALCYGWIDCGKKHIDRYRYKVCFRPRLPGRAWSARDLAYAEALLGAGRMTEAGIATVPAAVRQRAVTPQRPS